MNAASVDLQLSSGSLRLLRLGPEGGGPVVCVPGLSANARSFDALSARLAQRGRQVVALDLRGRGFSPATAAGTYGWRHHAEDVLEAAGRLGFAAFDKAQLWRASPHPCSSMAWASRSSRRSHPSSPRCSGSAPSTLPPRRTASHSASAV